METDGVQERKKVDFSSVTAILILVIIFILFFFDILYENKSFIYGDNLYVFLPFKHLLWESLRSFRIPHWTSLSSCGFPFLSIVFPGTFYLPDYIFFLLLPAYKALSLSLVFHLLFGALSIYAYMRFLKISPFSSLIASLVFAFNGFMLGHLHDYAIVVCSVWLPLIFLFIEMAVRKNRFLFLFPAGIMLAFQMLAGHIQPASYSLLASALYLFFRSLYGPDRSEKPMLRRMGRAVSWEILMLGTALGLAAIQLIPTIHFIGLTNRAEGSDIRGMMQGSFHPLHFLILIFPFFFGRQIPTVLTDHYWGKGFFWEFCPYIGVLPLLLCLIPIFIRKDFHKKFYLFLFLFSFVLFLGPRTPFYALFLMIPKFQQFRIPAKALLLFVFSASVLAGFGMEAILKSQGQNKKRIMLWYRACSLFSVILLLSLVAWNIFLFLHPAIIENLFRANPFLKKGDTIETLRATTGLFKKETLISLSFLFIGLGFFRYRIREKIKNKIFIFFVPVLIVLDLFLFYSKVVCPSPPFGEPYFKPAALPFLSDMDHSFRMYTPIQFRPSPEKKNILTPNIHLLYKIPCIWQAPRTNLSRFDDLLTYVRQNDFSPGHRNVYDLMAARYILSLEPLKGDRLMPLHEKNFFVYLNETALPRAYLVYKTRQMPDPAGIPGVLTDPSFHPGEEAVVEEQCILRPAGPEEKGEVSILADCGDLVQIEARLSRRGLLVLSDVFFPGWQVRVDGRQKKILRVNYAFRGVVLPAGRHLVEFQFNSPPFPKAVAVCGGTAFVILLVSIFTRWPVFKRKRQPRPRIEDSRARGARVK